MKANILARIKRNKFVELAGENYRNEDSEIVKYLNSLNKKAFLGIQREDGLYTVIGENSTYYLTPSGIEGEIHHEAFLKILSKNALTLGKTSEFEFVTINEQDAVWIQDAPMMNALWNTIMFLNDAGGNKLK